MQNSVASGEQNKFDFFTKKGNWIREFGTEYNERTGKWDVWVKNLSTRECALVTKEQLAAMVDTAPKVRGVAVPEMNVQQLSMGI